MESLQIINGLPLKKKLLANRKGQVLVEFVLMLVVIASVSIAMVKVVNGHLATRWKAAIETITKPTDTNIQIR